jgi:virulence-associated protein VapD
MLQHPIEDPLPNGWASRRGEYIYTEHHFTNLTNTTASVYREIASVMENNGFLREQYSIWQVDTTALFAWNTMLATRRIRPLGILATVVRRLQMFHVTPHIFIVTNRIRLGGVFSPTLLGPTPSLLAQGMGAPPPPNWPNGPADHLPLSVRNVQSSMNPNSWRLPVRVSRFRSHNFSHLSDPSEMYDSANTGSTHAGIV